ncbi:hypothetical protein DID88_004786 [Monilinia fructigena]|uniref:Uncharacterized protein n=1 Tax=Monilinia fructigena TaxID=38457 RepID=A0A395IPH2_9HELO|nr:hypothetical protein DID88_004786 [Monilinia fructigena]
MRTERPESASKIFITDATTLINGILGKDNVDGLGQDMPTSAKLAERTGRADRRKNFLSDAGKNVATLATREGLGPTYSPRTIFETQYLP